MNHLLSPFLKDYNYFSHVFHGKIVLPHDQFNLDNLSPYSLHDLERHTRLATIDESYYKDLNILDLGCHIGYFSYLYKQLGAKSVHGVNKRQYPIDVANYVFGQLKQTNYTFDVADTEGKNYLSKVCQGKDTVLLTLALEHLKNPLWVLQQITDSDVKNIIFESSLYEANSEPALKYYLQDSSVQTRNFDEGKEFCLGAVPNLKWIELAFYNLGWQIKRMEKHFNFNENWFSVPNHQSPPRTYESVFMLATKFS